MTNSSTVLVDDGFSPNASSKRDILGTALLSVLAGHTRYAHANIIRNDGVNPELLGMSTVSEDALRRNLKKIDKEKGVVTATPV